MYNFHVFTVIFRSSPFSHENVELANHTSLIFLTWTFRQCPIALYQNIQASQRRVQFTLFPEEHFAFQGIARLQVKPQSIIHAYCFEHLGIIRNFTCFIVCVT